MSEKQKNMLKKLKIRNQGPLALLVVVALFTVACQKARMTTVRYTPPAPNLVPTAPPPMTPPPQQLPVQQPPSTPLTPPGKGRGPLQDPILDRPDAPRGPVRPVIEVYNSPPPSFAPIASNEVPAPPSRQTVIRWLDDPTYRPPNVLHLCRGEICPPKPCQNCGENEALDSYVQRPHAFDKLDVIFMFDTSASLYPQYENITKNIGRFVHALPEGTDLRFAAMTGHGPDPEAAVNGQVWFGKFWKYATSSGQTPDSAIIPAGKLDKASGTFLNSPTERPLTLEHLANWLLRKLVGQGHSGIPHDRSEAQGEALLSNLNHFLRFTFDQNSQAHATHSSQIFPRTDAALAVIFISDENDVCYDYGLENILRKLNGQPELFPNFASGDGLKDRYGITRDKYEHRSFMSNTICRSEGLSVDYDLVAEALRQRYHKSAEDIRPVILSGIMHLTNDSIPPLDETQYPYAKDREMGHGFLGLIEAFGGEPVDINENNFGDKLGQIGDLSKFKLNYENTIPLKKNGELVDLRVYKLSTLRASILKSSGASIAVPSDKIYIVFTHYDDQNRGLHANMVIDRTYMQGVISPGDTIQIYMQ